MSRKKAMRRKVKTTDDFSRQSPNLSSQDHTKLPSEEFIPKTASFHSGQVEQDFPGNSAAPQTNPRGFDQETSLRPGHWTEQPGKILDATVMIKTEPTIGLDQQACRNESNPQGGDCSRSKQVSDTYKPAKIKRERFSLDSSLCSGSAPKPTPTMDLGSHLQQSLSSLQSGTDLTWSQLLEARNLPRVHFPPENPPKDVVFKIEEPVQPALVLCSIDDDMDLDFGADKSSSLEKSDSVNGKEKTGLSGTGMTSSSNRFSKNHDGGGGGSLLDLSKKTIPPEIRRVLASRYLVTKRSDEGHSGSVVPNLSKSRSRFTHSSKRAGVTDSEDEGSNRTETPRDSGRSKETDRSTSYTQTSTSLFREVKQSSIAPKSRSVSPREYSGLKGAAIPAKVLNKRRFSSSTYEGRRSASSSSYSPLDHREAVTDKLQSRGLVDLGSHYGSLLKDSPPPLTGRNSKSPYEESGSTLALERATDITKCLDEHRGALKEAKRRPQSALVDLSAGSTKGKHGKGLPQGTRRSSFVDDLRENSREHTRDKAHREGSGKLKEGRSVRVSGRCSCSPMSGDSKARNPEETDILLGSTSHFDRLRDPLHSSTGGSSRSPLVDDVTASGSTGGPMIDLNSSTSQLTERVSQRHDKSPFSSSYLNEEPGHSRPSRTEEPMIGLNSGNHFNLSSAKHAMARSSSRSPIMTDRPDKSRPPNGGESMIELRTGKQYNDYLNTAKHDIRSSRSPVTADPAGKSGPPDQHRSSSRSPDYGAANTDKTMEKPMLDLSSHLHERRGAPRMKPLDAMIDLSSMENPTSPLSPGFGALPFAGFPSQVYRPNNRPRYPYKSRLYRGHSSSGSPGFSPRLPFGQRFNYPPSPRYRIPGAPMIDLGNFGKSGDLQGMASSRPSEIPKRPVRMHSSRENPKRRHSLDSQSLNEPAKKPRMTVPGQRPEVKQVGSGVKLNVNDLLHLEREEQRYIQDLSLVQSQLTEIRFKMQRMQQDMEKLQSSEVEIKQRIDVVRAKRVKILRDAQDNEGSQGVKGTLEVLGEGYRGKASEEKSDAREDGKSKSPEKSLDENKETITDRSRSDGSTEQNRYKYGKTCMPEDHNLAPSELVLRASHGNGHSSDTSDPHCSVLSADAPSVPRTQHYPVTSSSNDRSTVTRNKPTTLGRADWDRSSQDTQEKISTEIETFESSSGSTITLNSDGTLVLRKTQTGDSGQLARKRSNSTILDEVCADFDAKRSECSGYTQDESQQFLGCLEITSTTEEPLVAEDDGPKEVLAEKERECLASKLRCGQDTISSTVTSLEIEQDDNSLCTAGEMDFIGHTDAVCCILPYKGKLFSASADRTVKAFDLKTGDCIKTFKGHALAVNSLQISDHGAKTDRLFTGANDQTVRAYNVKSGACTHKFSFRGRVMCLHVAFDKLFVGLSSGFVAVIDLKTNECIDQFNCHEPSRISCLSSATEGQRSLLCTGSFDSTISIRDESTGLLLRHIKDHKLTVLCMQVVENLLFSGSADTVVQSHNINTGELVRSYTGHTMSVSGLQALGGVLVTSSLDRIIRCFDIKTGDLLQLYGGNTDMIFSLSVFRDMIYTGCRDGRVSGIKLDLRKYHCCKWGDCSLKFGLLNHLKQHVQDHINQMVDFKSCFWDECIHKFPRGKQLDVIQAATEHILSHVPNARG